MRSHHDYTVPIYDLLRVFRMCSEYPPFVDVRTGSSLVQIVQPIPSESRDCIDARTARSFICENRGQKQATSQLSAALSDGVMNELGIGPYPFFLKYILAVVNNIPNIVHPARAPGHPSGGRTHRPTSRLSSRGTPLELPPTPLVCGDTPDLMHGYSVLFAYG